MAGRKKIDEVEEYVVTRIGYSLDGDFEKAREMACRAGRLRKDIWQEYGSTKGWGIKADKLYPAFREKYPATLYDLDSKQHQKTFERVISDIRASQEAAKSYVIKQIYRKFKPEKDAEGNVIEESSFRSELIASLKTLEWMQYPLIHRWMREAYRRGHTDVDNQICVGTSGNGATVKRISKNVVEISIRGDKISKKRYEQLVMRFKVGRTTPSGLFQIIFDDVSGKATIHFPKVQNKREATNGGSAGLDKGMTEVFADSEGNFYGEGLSKITNEAADKRNERSKGRNKLYQIAIKTVNAAIFACNLGKKRWNEREEKKRRRATNLIRKATNQVYDTYSHVVVEDLSSTIKAKRGKKKQGRRNRRASEWTKGIIQTAIEEISSRRKSSYAMVHCAFTSQVDSRYGVLLGTRKGDQFFTFDGEVLHADSNAGIAIQKRENDPDIRLWMHHNQVRAILVKRTAYFLSLRGLTLNDAIERGWFNPEHLKKAGLEVDGYRVIAQRV